MVRLIAGILFLFTASYSFGQEGFKNLVEKGNKALENNSYKEALEAYKLALHSDDVDSSQVCWYASLAGICAQELGDSKTAIQYYNQSIKLNSTDMDIFERLIQLCIDTKDHENLESIYLTARDRFPEKQHSFNNKLLYFYYNNKAYSKAVDIADKILGYKPGHTKTMYMKAVSLAMGSQNEEAKKVFKEVLATDPGHAKANTQLGLLYYREATKVFDVAVRKYNQLKNPSRLDYSNFRKEKATSWEGYEQAVNYLLKAYENSPTSQVKQALYNSYERLEKKDMAAKYK